MLTRARRLSKKKDFERVLKGGKFDSGEFLALKYTKNGLSESRIGIIVSQKVAKKAVKRNKIKRRMREIIRKKINKVKSGYDIVILTKPGIVEKKYSEVDELLQTLLKKSSLLANSH